MTEARGVRIHITGVVQGVGFRPFVYSLAQRHAISGWVRNTSAGVEIEAAGAPSSLEAFVTGLRQEAPPLARIDDVQVSDSQRDGDTEFRILPSQAVEGAFQPISPDVGLCADCLRELRDPVDRRYRYPFINCTNCGPRFTIIDDIPYDRPNTTMRAFPMCDDCAREYHDPADRRFHAQPVACPVCGPQVWFEVQGERLAEREQALQAARRMLADGGILAVKGLGGFHLAVDATRPDAVTRLRQRKLRVDKAFAVMLPDLEAVERHCELDDVARAQLSGWERPIVILPRRAGSTIAPEVAPGQDTLGVLLPYTPLHHLLIAPAPGFPEALVMTSGNRSEEPIAFEDDQARGMLAPLADGFLMHDRPIRTRCDDSVLRLAAGDVYPLRRSRGYAPYPVHLPQAVPPILGTGAELKNAFCLTRERYAFLSHHIGDLENFETLESFERGIAHLERLFRIQPQAIACDSHPDYLATRYAQERSAREGLPLVQVQHHHAHIAAAMAEHRLPVDSEVLGISLDGTGYGEDGTVWGGEFLRATYGSCERLGHLLPVPMPGGDQAVRQPWRMALAWLQAGGLPWEADLPPVQAAGERLPAIESMLAPGSPLRAMQPLTSSMGRLFDAAASLAGVRHQVNYEAQAAIEFEAAVERDSGQGYPVDLREGVLDPTPMLAALVEDLHRGASIGAIAWRFHRGMAEALIDLCQAMRRATGLEAVVLSGGVWQNVTLLELVLPRLTEAGLRPIIHRKVPANDGGIALGQVAVAAAQLGAWDSG